MNETKEFAKNYRISVRAAAESIAKSIQYKYGTGFGRYTRDAQRDACAAEVFYTIINKTDPADPKVTRDIFNDVCRQMGVEE